MSLPTEAIDEILELANNRHQPSNPSPRGVADPNVFAASPGGGDGKQQTKVAGSSTSTQAYSALDHFRDKATAERAITQCATRFLGDVVGKAFAMTGHCGRMTVHTADVAEALELFVEVDAEGLWYRSFPTGRVEGYGEEAKEDKGDEGDEERMDEEWQDDEKLSKEALAEDDTLVYDESDSEAEDEDLFDREEEPYIDDREYNLTKADAPNFDASYPPVDERKQMTDDQFREHLLVPMLEERGSYSMCPRAFGVDIMLKRAMYAFLVAKLS